MSESPQQPDEDSKLPPIPERVPPSVAGQDMPLGEAPTVKTDPIEVDGQRAQDPAPVSGYTPPGAAGSSEMTMPTMIMAQPERIGRYRIGDKIGEGGMGQVYRATQDGTGLEVAVKILKPDLARDPEFIARFEREAKVASSIVHENIVQVYDSGCDKRFT